MIRFSALRLTHKMLILLVLPAVIQAVLIVVLITLDDKAAHSAVMAQQQAKAIKIVDEMLFDFGLTIGAMFTRVVGAGTFTDTRSVALVQERRSLDSSSVYRTKMNARLAALKQICTSPEDLVVVEKAAALVDKQAESIKDLESEPEWVQESGVPPLTVVKKVLSLRESLRNMGRFFENYRKLLGYNYRRQEMYLREEAEQRLAVRNYIVLVLGLQAAFSLIAIIWFSRSTAKRIKLLVENADALPHLKSLPNDLDGGDELAHLDSTLHNALVDLKAADSLKNNLLNMVAHDVRSPVATASLILSNLKREGPQALEAKGAAVEQLSGLLKTIGALVADLLTFQKADSGRMELSFSELSINDLIQEVVTEMTPVCAERGISIKIVSATDHSIIADRVKIGQVLRNYLSNAIKFSPDASVIEIRCVPLEKALKISVVDHGSGIPAGDVHNLFEQFVQVQGAKSELGFGLGLHICKLIIDLHGGTVGVQSQPNTGSEFWFTLPFDEAP